MPHPHRAQLQALATLAGLTLALLRTRGVVSPEEVVALPDLAAGLLPEDPSGMSDMLLAIVRNIAAMELGPGEAEADR